MSSETEQSNTVDFDQFAGLPPQLARETIPGWLLSHMDVNEATEQRVLAGIRGVLDTHSDDQIQSMMQCFAQTGTDYRLWPADPVGRAISRAFMYPMIRSSKVNGLDNLRAAMAMGPTLLLANHLSYSDTQLTDVLLAQNGAADIADAIVAVAGPKVYATPFRRVAAMCLSTLKTAQSSSLVHNEAGLTPREVGRIAIETVRRAGELMNAGRPVLVYAEGARSRDRRLQPFLKAVSKYAGLPNVVLVPVAISGSDNLYPVDAPKMLTATIQLSFGAPITAADLGRRVATEQCWRAVAGLLPLENQPTAETLPFV